MYVKFNYKGGWFFYGPWENVQVRYVCKREVTDKGRTYFSLIGPSNPEHLFVDEIFVQNLIEGLNENTVVYTVIIGNEKGTYRGIALYGCTTFLLNEEGKTMEKLN